eukprot:1023546-Ditylum_brightwellii.AAC.1
MDTVKKSSSKCDCHQNDVDESMVDCNSDVNVSAEMNTNNSEGNECPVDIYVNGVLVMDDGMEGNSNNIISSHDDNESEEEERLND